MMYKQRVIHVLTACTVAIVCACGVHPSSLVSQRTISRPLIAYARSVSHYTNRQLAETARPLCQPWRITQMETQRNLVAITAVNSHDVWAVGWTGTGSATSPLRPLIEHWNGRRWREIAGATGAMSGQLSGVADSAPDDVWAVGDLSYGAFVEHWNGRRWHIAFREQVNPASGAPSSLSGVVALSRQDAWAVGDSLSTEVRIYHWDGHQWRRMPGGPLPEGGSLDAVAAATPHDIWAVGDRVTGYRSILIEHWDGRRWSTIPHPDPAPAYNSSRLLGVAAISSHDAWAVGGYKDATGQSGGAIIEHWDGYRWRVTPSPPVDEELTTVAAASGRDVWAAGSNIIEHWDGQRWSLVPGPTGLVSNVAVVSRDDIWGVGTDQARGTVSIVHGNSFSCSSGTPRSQTIAIPGEPGYENGTPLRIDAVRPTSLAVDEHTQRAFVATRYGSVVVVDTAHGRLLRAISMMSGMHVPSSEPPGSTFLSLTADVAHRRVYVARGYDVDPRASVAVLDARTGALRSVLPGGPRAIAIAVGVRLPRAIVLNAPASLSNSKGSVTILDTRTGQVIRTVPLTDVGPLALDEMAGRIIIAGQTTVTLLDARTGAMVAHLALGLTNTPGQPASLAVDEQAGLVYVSAVIGRRETPSVRVLDATTGTIHRTVPLSTSANIIDDLVIDHAHGRLIVDVSGDAYLVSLSNHSITPLATNGCAAGVGISPHTGRIYVSCQVYHDQYGDATARGDMLVFDGASGALLSRTRVGFGPDTITIDAHDRVAVLQQGGIVLLDGMTGLPIPARAPLPTVPISAACCGASFFVPVGHTLDGPFRSFWTRYGGLMVFGYPRTEPFVEDAHWVQYTERTLLRLVGGQVQVAPLGRLLTTGRQFRRSAPFTSTGARLYFPAAGHSLSGAFLTFWRRYNGPLLFGAPISEVITETNGDRSGRRYLLQWFDKGRLEYHPEAVGTGYIVQMGLLGVQDLRRRGWLPSH